MGLKEAAFRLGIIGLVQFVPLFLLTLITGWTAPTVSTDGGLLGPSTASDLGPARWRSLGFAGPSKTDP